jgi:ABC-type Fe3+-siderophore transport system permease subunit
LIVAVGLTGAYAESVPNLELLTLTAFLGGMLLGVRDGAAVGGLCMLIFSLLNPYGPAHPLVTASQVLGECVAGAAGGVVARARLERRPRWLQAATLALVAVALTAFYDLATNLATGLIFGQVRFWLLAGIPFSLWHIAWNLALFVAIGTALLGVIPRYAARLS